MKNFKRIIAIITVLVIALLSFAGCNQSKSTDEAKVDGTIKIGFIGPLTGDGTPWGTAELNSLKMRVEELNASGGVIGKKVELKYYDNRMDNVETTNVARKLISQDEVVAIIGTNSSSAAIALAGVCESSKIPQIATTATNTKVTIKDDGTVRPWTFRVTLTDPQLAKITANFAADELKYKNVAVLYEIGSDYSIGQKDAFTQAFEAKGGKITTIEAYKTGDVDFRAQLAKIKSTNPDAIFMPALYKEVSLIANQVRAIGIECPLLGSDSWNNKDLFTVAKDALQGSYFCTPTNGQDPGLDDFKERYNKKYGFKPGGEGGNAFFASDAFDVLVDSIERAGKADPQAIRDAIEQTKDVKGLTTLITMAKDTHNPQREGVICKIEGEDFKFVNKVMP